MSSTPTPGVKISQTFNGRVEWQVPGGYFKILTGLAVDVELWSKGVRVLNALACDAGFYQRVDFDKIVLTNAASQLTEFLAADQQGGSDRFTGTFTLAGAAHTDSSKTATNASTQALAANANRKYLAAQVPPTAAAGVWLRSDGGAASVAAGSVYIAPGQMWEPGIAPTGQINMIRDTTAANIDFTVIEA
jgi:hypothetical protein